MSSGLSSKEMDKIFAEWRERFRDRFNTDKIRLELVESPNMYGYAVVFNIKTKYAGRVHANHFIPADTLIHGHPYVIINEILKRLLEETEEQLVQLMIHGKGGLKT